MTEKDKMLAGAYYDPLDPQLCKERDEARLLFHKINSISEDHKEERDQLIYELLGKAGKGLWVEPPLYVDYGKNIQAGENFFMNFGCCILDVAPVTIGDNVMFGPNVQMYTASHPLNAKKRHSGKEFGKPITIGNYVWIGGNATICPGVTLGNGVVVGAGAVVTKSFPDNVFIAGNPARIIKTAINDS